MEGLVDDCRRVLDPVDTLGPFGQRPDGGELVGDLVEMTAARDRASPSG
jgi:hypothetical protein